MIPNKADWCEASVEEYFHIMIFALIFCCGKVDENKIFPFLLISTELVWKYNLW